MSIYGARLRNTSNALSPQVSSEQIRLQVPPKLINGPSEMQDLEMLDTNVDVMVAYFL